jgi:hypothetical protein
MPTNPFTRHPTSVDETYGEHFAAACSFAGPLLLAGLACLVHAFLPFLFEKTGSTVIAGLHDRMVANRRRHPKGRLAAPGMAAKAHRS